MKAALSQRCGSRSLFCRLFVWRIFFVNERQKEKTGTACLFLLVLSRLTKGKSDRCGGLIKIVQETLGVFPAHTLSLRDRQQESAFSP